MRYLFISLCCFSLLSCATIPDQAYHKVVCAIEDSCAITADAPILQTNFIMQPYTNLDLI